MESRPERQIGEVPGGRRWGALALEMLVIVGSILFAFSLDAWWDQQQLDADTRAQLESLRDELVQSREGLDVILASVQRQSAGVGELLALLREAGDGPVYVPNALLGAAVSWRTSDVSLSTLESLRVSGHLANVKDPQLRNALAGFPAIVRDAQEDEELARVFVEQVLAPVLAHEGLAEAAYGNRLGYADPAVAGGETLVRPTLELKGLLVARQAHSGWSIGGLPRIGVAMDQLIELIDREL